MKVMLASQVLIKLVLAIVRRKAMRATVQPKIIIEYDYTLFFNVFFHDPSDFPLS
jgi:hypothetical protein